MPVTGPEQQLVKMTVSGGYAGVDREVTLRGDGTVRVRDKGESALRRTSAAQFTRLRTLLGDPALADVPAFTIDLGAADMFQYALQFDGRTGSPTDPPGSPRSTASSTPSARGCRLADRRIDDGTPAADAPHRAGNVSSSPVACPARWTGRRAAPSAPTAPAW
ncbi:hypothetical protein [Streptomyces sp. ALI-76-A]|uniref:hypothetical protein n=1 Tax=Streptomyces sp. ALI-76-A TaxID=3025736 RepID=UPI00256EDBE3|nr:hypothetical protein [Streptomyces sp. ALI-76-A]MDL5199940.1 hypothetical protein [Streptomyces sp. ALI-76-A]